MSGIPSLLCDCGYEHDQEVVAAAASEPSDDHLGCDDDECADHETQHQHDSAQIGQRHDRGITNDLI